MYVNGNIVYNEKVFSAEQQLDIINSYLNHESSVSIGKRYNVSHKPILKVLHRNGIEVSQAKTVRKYNVDEQFFDVIDTPEKAYVLGLLYSDGSNNPSKSTVSISLQKEDKELLEHVRLLLKSDKPLEYLDYSNKKDFGYTYKDQYRLLIFSKHICDAIEKLGVVKNKSLIIDFPSFISDELMPHFVRGVYDGDGSVYMQCKNDNNHAVTVTITATNNFCIGLKRVVEESLGIACHIYDASCHNGITKVFTLSGRNVAKKFLDWIYENPTIYLQRKYARYLEYYDINNSLSV